MKLIPTSLFLFPLLLLFACQPSDSYQQIGFYTLRENLTTDGTDTAAIKRFDQGVLVEEILYSTLTQDSREHLRYNQHGDMTYSKTLVPSAGYALIMEIGYAPARYINSIRRSMQLNKDVTILTLRYEEEKIDNHKIKQKVYDLEYDTLVGITIIHLNENGLVSKREESWTSDTDQTETYAYNAAGQKTEVKTIPTHDHHDHDHHEGHSHAEVTTTTFEYDSAGRLTRETSSTAHFSQSSEYEYDKAGKLKRITTTQKEAESKKTIIEF